MESRGRSMDSSHVALAATAVSPGVAVQDLPPESAPRDAHVVIVARDGGEVADDKDDLVRRNAPADETEDVLHRSPRPLTGFPGSAMDRPSHWPAVVRYNYNREGGPK